MGAKGLIVVLVCAASAAQAGITIRSSSKSKDEPNNVFADGNRLRMENGAHVFIFDGDRREMIVADTGKREYSVVTEAQMKAMAEKVRAHLETMKAQMAKLPPEQRQRIEQMQEGMGKASARYDRLGPQRHVAGYTCDMYRVSHGAMGGKGQACFIPWNSGKIRKDELHAFKLMGDFLAEMMPGMGLAANDPRRNLFADMPGVPALMLNEDGEVVQELRSIERGSIPADKFAVPAGFTRRTRSMFEQ